MAVNSLTSRRPPPPSRYACHLPLAGEDWNDDTIQPSVHSQAYCTPVQRRPSSPSRETRKGKWSMMRTRIIAGLVATLMASAAPAFPAHPQAEAQALDLAKQAIALRSVRGPGNKTPEVAALYKAALVAGGFKDSDVTITPVDDDTAYLIATWPGSDPSLKPIDPKLLEGVSRNAPCPCGSGKKFKHCHGTH